MTINSKAPATGSGSTPFDVTVNAIGTDKLIYVLCTGKAPNTELFTGMTMGAESGQVVYTSTVRPIAGSYCSFAIIVFTDNQITAGVKTFTPSFVGQNTSYIVIEASGRTQTAPFIRSHVFDSAGDVDAIALTATLAGEAGEEALFYVSSVDGGYYDPTLTSVSANLANQAFGDATLSMVFALDDAAIDSASENYSVTYNHGRDTVASDSVQWGAFVLPDDTVSITADSITAAPIYAGDTVTIDLSNATNAAGKTLSIPQGALTATAQDINSISFLAPDLRTFGDKTGDYSTNITITVDDAGDTATIDFQVLPDVGDEVGDITAIEGIYAEAAFSGVAITDMYYTATISGADFTVGAVPVLGTEQVFNLWIQDQTDGVWGDPFTVTIPGSANPGLLLTLRDAESSNSLIASETSLTIHVYDTDGGTELFTTTVETTDASGILEIDSDLLGAVDDSVFIVAIRSNGQTCCGYVTVIDLSA